MSLRRFSIFIFLFAFGVVLSGCNSDTSDNENSEDAGNGGEINLALESSPTTLDPVMSTSTPTKHVARHIFESLYAMNTKLQAEPMLAKSVDISEDGKTYTFELREDIKFHDGSVMTAEDAVASIERWYKQEPLAQDVLIDANFEEDGESTFVLKMEKQANSTLKLLAQEAPPILPKEIIESESIEGENLIGTGPFKFEDWKQDQYVHLKKNEEYEPVDSSPDGLAGKKEALVEDIYFRIVTDSSTRDAGVETGEYDIARALNYDSFDRHDNNSDLETNLDEYGKMALVFNKKSGFFQDKKARQAINAAIDVDNTMQAAFGNEEFYSIYPGIMNERVEDFYSEAGKEGFNQKDLDKAQKLLDETDYDGEEIKILTYRDDEYHYKSAVAVQEKLKEIGVNIELTVTDQATYSELREDPEEWDMFTVGLGYKFTPIIDLSLDPEWYGWPVDEKLKKLKNEIAIAKTDDEAKEIWDELQEYLSLEYVPITILGRYKKLSATRNNVENYQEFKGPILWNTSINE